MGLMDKMLGPRRDSADVTRYDELVSAQPEPWTRQGKEMRVLERNLGPRVVDQILRERGR